LEASLSWGGKRGDVSIFSLVGLRTV
jgi:hypothetical protein